MTTLNLNDDLINAVQDIAAQRHTTAEQLITDALLELIEDYRDIQAAEAALKRIENGEDQLLSWQEVKAGLYDLDN